MTTTANDVNVDVVVLTDGLSDIIPTLPSASAESSAPAPAAASHNSINNNNNNDDAHAHGLAIALDKAERGFAQGGIPIGSALLTSAGDCLGSGHNMRLQRASPTLHAEMAALEDAGRLSATVYRDCTLVGFLALPLPFFFFFKKLKSSSLTGPNPSPQSYVFFLGCPRARGTSRNVVHDP